MVREGTLTRSLDEEQKPIYIGDFAAGLNSETDPQDIALNESPDCQNVKLTQDGRCIGRDGYIDRLSSLAAVPDGGGFFYDKNNNRRDFQFMNGNLYEITDPTVNTLIATGVTAAGTPVASVAFQGKLYYSDGTTISGGNSGTRIWDPVAATDVALVSAGTAGTISTPAANVLGVYAGSLIWGDITYVAGTTDRHAFMWSNVNDPTTLLGTSIQQVGQGVGGFVNSVMPLGVAATGVSPFRSFLVGKSRFGVYLYSGALGTLTEILVNCPTGVRDGSSMQYVPATGPEGGAGGYSMFLGTDLKFWLINGTQAREASLKFRKELNNYVTGRLSISNTQRFRSCLNTLDFQYICDLGGNRQYVMHTQTGAWTRYSGWPSGWMWESKDGNGIPRLLCATANKTISQLNVNNYDGTSTAIAPYWTTGYLFDGLMDIYKIFKFFYLTYRTDVSDMIVTSTVNLGQGNSSTKTIAAPALSSAITSRFDTAVFDTSTFAAADVTYTPYKKRIRLNIADGQGSFEDLRGNDIQFKISQSVAGAYFEILGFTATYLRRGRQRVANL